MSRLRFDDVTIMAGDDGSAHPAKLTVCPDCGSNAWLIFFIEAQTHPHVQCVGCDTTFCFQGKCV